MVIIFNIKPSYSFQIFLEARNNEGNYSILETATIETYFGLTVGG